MYKNYFWVLLSFLVISNSAFAQTNYYQYSCKYDRYGVYKAFAHIPREDSYPSPHISYLERTEEAEENLKRIFSNNSDIIDLYYTGLRRSVLSPMVLVQDLAGPAPVQCGALIDLTSDQIVKFSLDPNISTYDQAFTSSLLNDGEYANISCLTTLYSAHMFRILLEDFAPELNDKQLRSEDHINSLYEEIGILQTEIADTMTTLEISKTTARDLAATLEQLKIENKALRKKIKKLTRK